MSVFSHAPHHGATDVWLTPPQILQAVGPFDIDPCAAPEPRPWPTAARHYDITRGEDGLVLPWSGLVFLNPPFSDAQKWLEKLAAHEGGGIALLLARTETAWWFKTVWDHYSGAMFLRGRLHFHRPDGSRAPMNCGAPPVLVAYRDEALRRLASSELDGHLVIKNQSLREVGGRLL